MSSITTEMQSLAPTALIELFILDMTNLPNGDKSYWHAGTNKLTQPIVWQGQQYLPLPIEAEGFDINTDGTTPRPKVRVANIEGLFSAEVRNNDDLVNCKIIRKRTHARFLDAVNFPNGNPEANPHENYPDQLWYINRKTNETKYMIEWELVSAFDLRNATIPARQVLQNSCAFRYRGAECGWTGTFYYDENQIPQWDASADKCGKTMTDCRVRFKEQPIRFGGFPGARRYES